METLVPNLLGAGVFSSPWRHSPLKPFSSLPGKSWKACRFPLIFCEFILYFIIKIVRII